MLSAAGAVASGVLDSADKNMTASSVVGIGGGVAGGVLGFATLGVHRTAAFRHDRNILAEVWYGKDHPDLPEAVWVYLTRTQFGTSPGHSTRESLTAKWKASGRLGDDPEHPSADRIALDFGTGGIYDADGLENRAEMLTEIRDVVDLMNHNFRQLETDVSHRSIALRTARADRLSPSRLTRGDTASCAPAHPTPVLPAGGGRLIPNERETRRTSSDPGTQRASCAGEFGSAKADWAPRARDAPGGPRRSSQRCVGWSP